ncbi:dynein regulatory complex protein 1-like [Amphibalanus amphitrite]|uniref:dynein regulatory complex protein 1-like n=1 Tax=Amphibalanus amphitrite TaxID=1232801 RepID=UPI001C8FEBEF|nr:dynein regulatory complex protein 1-like [Amphibalanus amphitrite]
MADRGNKMDEEAFKNSMAADLESEDTTVRINARRLRIQRFKESVRRQEQLAQLGLGSAPVEVPLVERQLAESGQKLEKLEDDGLEMVTNVPVAFQGREADHRANTELSLKQRQERLKEDDELSEQRFNDISELWDSAIARAPSRLHAHLCSQRALCDQLLAQKDQVVRSLEAELRCMDDEYNLEVTTHGQDTTVLIQRMKDQLVILRNAYSRELEDIYGAMKQDLDETRGHHQEGWQEKLDEIVALEEKRLASYIQMTEDHDQEMHAVYCEDADEYRQMRSTLEKDVELLQQQLEQLKAACLLNTEKLDYNYQVLRRRDEESTITKSQQKRKLNKLQDVYNGLRQKLAEQERSQRVELQQLTTDIRRLTDMLVDVGERNQHFIAVHSRQLHQIFQMTHENCRRQLDKVIRADKVIHEQQLGLPFTPPALDHLAPPEMKADSAMEVVREALAGPGSDSDRPSSSGGGDGPPLSAVLAPGPPLLRRLLLLLGDESGFLVERRLHRLLAGIDAEDATLLRLDAVLAALGVRTQIDLDQLCKYFVRYATPVASREELPAVPGSPPPVPAHAYSSPALAVASRSGSAAPSVRSAPSRESGAVGSLSDLLGDDRPPSSGDSTPPADRLLVSPDGVLHALADFLQGQRQRAGAASGSVAAAAENSASAAGRWARLPPPPTDADFWQRFLHVQPESQRRLWRALAGGLQRYNTVLQERQQLRLQVMELGQQNAELRTLLHSHLSRAQGGSG